MNHATIQKILAWLVALALCAAMLPAGLAEALDAPVEELQPVMLGEPTETSDAAAEGDHLQTSQPTAVSAENIDTPSDETAAEVEIDDTAPEESAGLMAAAVSGFHLNAESLRLGVRETFELSAALDGMPVSGAAFESAAPKVVTVTKTGLLKAKKEGTAVVTATWNGYTAQCAVEVVKAPTKVALSQTKASIGAGEKLQLSASIPEGTFSGITWTSSKTSVATVDQRGLVTAVSKGSATITARACNGKKAACKLTVAAAPTSIAFDREAVALSVGQTYVPNVKITGGSEAYSLSVSGDAVSADNGALTALKTGDAMVTASTYNGLTARLSVTVKPAPRSVRFPRESYAIGEKDTVTLTPVFDADVSAGLVFKSSNTKVAAVDDGGVVTGKKAGRVTVTVTTHNGLTAACTVQVYKAPSKIKLSKTSLTLSAGDTFTLEGILPENSYSTITWTSDAPEVASVDPEGLVTALRRGTAKITAMTANKKKATCKVKVVAPPTRLDLSRETMTLNRGKTGTVTWEMDSEGEVDAAIENTDVAVISKISKNKITVKAVAVGETVLNAVGPGGLSAAMTVVVAPVATYLRLPVSSVTLGAGESYAIAPETDAGGVSALTFTSSKPSVATVDAAGIVTAVSPGSATITVKTSNKKSAKLKVTVNKAQAPLSVSPTSLTLEPYEYRVLEVSRSSGVTFSSSDEYVAYVSKDGVVTGIHGGTATITAASADGQTALCQVTVLEAQIAPPAPAAIRASAVSESVLRASWDAVDAADGYRVYIGVNSSPEDATLFAGFDVSTLETDIPGLSPGLTWHVFVTAYNAWGETGLSEAAHAQAKTPGQASPYTVALNYSGDIMMAAGTQKTIFATISPDGYAGELVWQSSSDAVTFVSRDNGGCVIRAESPGEARVTARLDNGMSASVRVQVVNTGDLSDVNLANVQKAVAANEALMNEDEGGNVIWTMMEGRLQASGMSQSNASAIVEKVRGAESVFRDIYVMALGSYNIAAGVTRDRRGSSLGVSQFLMQDNTLYLVPSYSSPESYAYLALHETGHAVDYLGGEKKGLISENSAANAAITDDVRQLLLDRVDEAVSAAGVSANHVNRNSVVNAIMDYRTLLDESTVLSRLNSDEKQVYHQLTDLMEAEMNATLPMNNGSMVWDAVEGATNFAVSGNYGHAYLLQSPQYSSMAKYYYYDQSGNPEISAEPWAEFFGAKIMQDAATLAVNLAYLPKTCQYFTETLAPKLLNILKDAISAK